MENPLVKDLAGLSAPLKKLVEVVAAGCGRIYEPTHIRRVAAATADADRMSAQAALDIEALKQRAAEREEARRVRQQRNVESIAAKAAKYLPSEVAERPVDEDWAYDFFEECQDTASDELQELWAKLLATEVAQPGTCSKRTLKVVRSMSKQDAESFARFCSFVFVNNNSLLAIPTAYWSFAEHGVDSTALIELEDLGLLKVTDRVHIAVPAEGGGLVYFGHVLHMRPTSGTGSIPYVGLTARGAELRRVVSSQPDINYLNAVARRLRDELRIESTSSLLPPTPSQNK